ncbi:Putative DNA ligase-like protein [Paenibacillus konkukensis]|uniref:DNA ligase-like protein n=1 Tax=Paenibacillus konkukensis TaxID=2020716 RepID=A0ABY4RE53_9BACL|nr:DNA ligase [Paenibacillus konkukensis]UQZ80877.1 Putative DNA ligase-like protein [Paenibacillus konkukensis]
MLLFAPLKPMTAGRVPEPFDDENTIFEPKWDGQRILLHKQGKRIEAFTRRGMNVTAKFPELQEACASIQSDTAIVDCEGIVMRGERAVFDDFTYRLRISQAAKIRTAVLTHPVTFVAFDLLMSAREHLNEPLTERKRRLGDIIKSSGLLMPTLSVPVRGKALFELTERQGMAGIVAKRMSSRYRLGTKSEDWLQINHVRTIDVMILGYRTSPFTLVAGLNFRTVSNKPVGLVEQEIDAEDRQKFLELAASLHTHRDALTQWIEPCICCRIQYAERTDAHQLIGTVFQQFLWNKPASECVWQPR